MPMKKQDKVALVEELREQLANAPSIVVASSVGIDANSMNELRAGMRKSGSRYRVIKNTLAKLALKGTELETLAEHFRGPTALAYNADDAVAPAKVLVDFRKDHELLEIKAGYLNGTVLDAAGVEQLSKMPGKDEVRAKLLQVFNGVGTRVVRVLAAGPQSFLGVLNARKTSLEEG